MSELTNGLLSLLGGDLSLRWILTLVHFLWQGFAVGLLAVMLGRLLRNAPASIRYWLFATALLSLPICARASLILAGLAQASRLCHRTEFRFLVHDSFQAVVQSSQRSSGTCSKSTVFRLSTAKL